MTKEEKLFFQINVAERQEFSWWPHSPTFKAFHSIEPGAKVLDVGCAKGYMARELKKKKCFVAGIEQDIAASAEAKRWCDDLINADMEAAIDNLRYADGYFDVIICLEVLEHLIRPDLVLSKLKRYLNNSGRIILSVPNVARFNHRLQLLAGKFTYNSDGFGALSKGHLRFFTRRSIIELVEDCGYEIVKLDYTGRASQFPVFTGLLAFGFFLIACKK